MERIFLQLFYEGWNVAWVRNENIARAKFDADHRIHGEGEDMIERQGADEVEFLRLAFVLKCDVHPELHLLDIGENIVVAQHCAF